MEKQMAKSDSMDDSKRVGLNKKALLLMGKVNSKATMHLQENLLAYDLTPQQFNLLRILRGAKDENLNSKIIRERLIDKNADVSRLIGRLVDKELIELVVSDEDKRQRWVKLTESGYGKLSSIDIELKDFPFDFFNGISESDVETLIEIFEKI